MFTCLKNNGLDDHPNTIASNSTHKKERLLQKQLLKLMELTFGNAILKILQHKFATPVSTFPILFTYKGAGN